LCERTLFQFLSAPRLRIPLQIRCVSAFLLLAENLARPTALAIATIALALGLSCFVDRGVAQQKPIQAKTELVRIVASVMNPAGDFVGGLQPANFRVLDQGAESPVVYFSSDDAPANVVVMIETSPAVYLIRDQHLAAASALVAGLGPDDRVALVAYDEGPRGLLDLTTDKSALAAALRELQYTLGAGQLNFFDSVSQVVDLIAPITDKKALVLLTTGLDSSPRARFDALVAKLRTQDDVIYPVALGGSLRTAKPDKKKKASAPNPGEPPNPLTFAQSTADLKELAEITGGRAFFPESDVDFVPAYRQIAAALRHQYVLGITPQRDGTLHRIEIHLLDADGQPLAADPKNPGPHIFARQGYLAPSP
jgi:Ca-activated chloride channel homolog